MTQVHPADSYAQALGIIAVFLHQAGVAQADHHAPRLVAALARHDPPILMGYPEEFKDEGFDDEQE